MCKWILYTYIDIEYFLAVAIGTIGAQIAEMCWIGICIKNCDVCVKHVMHPLDMHTDNKYKIGPWKSLLNIITAKTIPLLCFIGEHKFQIQTAYFVIDLKNTQYTHDTYRKILLLYVEFWYQKLKRKNI